MEKYKRQLQGILGITLLLLGSGFFVYYFFNRTFEVTFYDKEGSIYEVVQVSYGKRISVPEDPKRDQELFSGWYDQNEKFDFTTKITKDYRLLAKWKKGATSWIKVTFANDLEEKTILIDQYGKVDRGEDPVKEGYIFLGWFLEDGRLFDFSKEVTEDFRLVAKWEKIRSSNEEKKPNVSPKPSPTPVQPEKPIIPDKKEEYTYSIEFIDRDKTSIERVLKVYRNGIEITSTVQKIQSNQMILGEYSEKLGGIRIVYQQFLKYSEYQILLIDGTTYKITEKKEGSI